MAMPTDPNTQLLSMQQMQNEFGGAYPINMSEYYWGASNGYVSTTRPTYPSSYVYKAFVGSAGVVTMGIVDREMLTGGTGGNVGTHTWRWYYNGTQISTANPVNASGNNAAVSYNGGSYAGNDSQRITFGTGGNCKSGTWKETGRKIAHFEAVLTNVPHNLSVPTAGEIKFSEFYGTYKT
tara:strand:- start:362 stop:901 length:540 start_codon:yes stop_codon:yes gene_type:complete